MVFWELVVLDSGCFQELRGCLLPTPQNLLFHYIIITWYLLRVHGVDAVGGGRSQAGLAANHFSAQAVLTLVKLLIL